MSPLYTCRAAEGGNGMTALPPLESSILLFLIQLLWTALLLRAFLLSQTAATDGNAGVSLEGLCKWIPVSKSFIAMMLTSIVAFSHSPTSAILIFGNIGPIVSIAVDYQLWGVSINNGGIASSPEDYESRRHDIIILKCHHGSCHSNRPVSPLSFIYIFNDQKPSSLLCCS